MWLYNELILMIHPLIHSYTHSVLPSLIHSNTTNKQESRQSVREDSYKMTTHILEHFFNSHEHTFAKSSVAVLSIPARIFKPVVRVQRSFCNVGANKHSTGHYQSRLEPWKIMLESKTFENTHRSTHAFSVPNRTLW